MIKLTHYSSQAGCSCKIQPKQLQHILSGMGAMPAFDNLLAGNKMNEDASVMDLGNGQALIQTTDFFTPIVNDAFDFGRIAAANAISDVYAMGGKPVMANGILGWPVEKLSDELATLVLKGAAEMCKEAGIPMAGGHSIVAPEPFFGLSVTGLVPLPNLKRNHTAKVGDVIYLTKKLGTGILASALKKDLANENDYAALLNTCTQLNIQGEWLGKCEEVTALTDVTGFGLLGHLSEMCGAGLGANIDAQKLPVLEEAIVFANKGIMPDSTFRNWNAVEPLVKGKTMEHFTILNDPQTNGGLLFSVDSEKAQLFEKKYKSEFPSKALYRIGDFTESGIIEVV
jgi:selenide, water dikinase